VHQPSLASGSTVESASSAVSRVISGHHVRHLTPAGTCIGALQIAAFKGGDRYDDTLIGVSH
jgi:hypothetical protein